MASPSRWAGASAGRRLELSPGAPPLEPDLQRYNTPSPKAVPSAGREIGTAEIIEADEAKALQDAVGHLGVGLTRGVSTDELRPKAHADPCVEVFEQRRYVANLESLPQPRARGLSCSIICQIEPEPGDGCGAAPCL